MRLVAEVAPAGPAAAGAVGLLALAGLIVALGLIKTADYFCRGLFGTASSLVSWVPWLGTKLSNGLHAVEQRLTNYLGTAAGTVDAAIASTWHATARTVEYLAHQMVAQAVALYQLAAALPHDLSKLVTQTIPQTVITTEKVVTHTTRTVTARVAALEREMAGWVAGTAATVARTVAVPLDQALEWDLARLRDRVRAIEDSASDLYRKARGVITVPAVAAVSAIVAVALTALGVNWIRCNNWGKIGRAGCRLPTQLLEDLLGLSLALLVVVDPEKIAEAAITTEDGIDWLVRKVAEIDDAAG